MSKIKQVRSGRFTQISNVIFEDTRLSYKEIGIYCNMLKFPDDWEFSLRYLAECHKDKKASVKSGLDKLLDYGYISRDENQTRNEKGMFSNYDYIIYQDPFDNPNYIPCPGKEIMSQLDQKPLSEYWPEMITEFENQPTDGTEAENRFTGNPLTDYAFTGNQPQTNTVYTNTVYTNTVLTNNEEDKDKTLANINLFTQKLMNIYMCYYYSSCSNPKAQKEMMQR